MLDDIMKKNSGSNFTKSGLNWVAMARHGLILWESGAVLVISIFRPIMDQKTHKKYKKIRKIDKKSIYIYIYNSRYTSAAADML